jgi:hypothetical protein
MKKKRSAQNYSADEFAAVVTLIETDAGLRADIEAITGQTLDCKTPRELFDLFRAINDAAEVQATVVRYGQARQAVRQTRAMLAAGALEELDPACPATKKIHELEARCDELKARNQRLEASNKALLSGRVAPIAPRVVKGEVAS